MNRKNPWQCASYTVQLDHHRALEITVSGRTRWALEALIAAGPKGCTPIDTPGPRWSAYVHELRNEGVPIETVSEPHGGPFKGTHARYVLRAAVSRNERVSA